MGHQLLQLGVGGGGEVLHHDDPLDSSILLLAAGGGGVLPLEFQHHVTDLLGEELDHKGGGVAESDLGGGPTL